MIENELSEPFMTVITEIFKPAILSIQPLSDNLTQGYVNCLDSSLDHQRLDTLIYSLFKLNEKVERLSDRRRLGFSATSQFQTAFSDSHPSTDPSVGFKAVLSDTNEDGNEMWQVTKTRGDDILESAVVLRYPEVAMLCDPSKCEVKCVNCSPDIRSCLHAFSCTCTAFKTHSACQHIHLIQIEGKSTIETNKRQQTLNKLSKLMDLVKNAANDDNYFDEVCDLTEKMTDKLIQKRNTSKKCLIGPNAGRHALIKEAMDGASPTNFAWCMLACGDLETTLASVSSLSLSLGDKQSFLDHLTTARSIWHCNLCHKYEVEPILSGFIECTICCNWYHRSCVDPFRVEKSDANEAGFVCEKCEILVADPSQLAVPIQVVNHPVVVADDEAQQIFVKSEYILGPSEVTAYYVTE